MKNTLTDLNNYLFEAIERIVRLIPLVENEGAVISMREYSEAAETAFKRVEGWRKENYGKIDTNK